MLEKKKDYVLRAKDFNRKKKTIKGLKEKALNRNPDEFYFKMQNSAVKDGVHRNKKDVGLDPEVIKVMKTQDLNYINLKRVAESRKIEKLQSSLHFLTAPQNTHKIFFEDAAAMTKFDAAKHFDTAPELVRRAFNRPSMSTLESTTISDKGNLACTHSHTSTHADTRAHEHASQVRALSRTGGVRYRAHDHASIRFAAGPQWAGCPLYSQANIVLRGRRDAYPEGAQTKLYRTQLAPRPAHKRAISRLNAHERSLRARSVGAHACA